MGDQWIFQDFVKNGAQAILACGRILGCKTDTSEGFKDSVNGSFTELKFFCDRCDAANISRYAPEDF